MSGATSVNGPHSPSSAGEAPATIPAATTSITHRGRRTNRGKRIRRSCLSQNRASWPGPVRAIQKLIPSLQAPKGNVEAPVETVPSGVMPAAFQRDRVLLIWLITRTRSPSKEADRGAASPLAVSVSRMRSEEHTSELQSLRHLVGRLLLEKQ